MRILCGPSAGNPWWHYICHLCVLLRELQCGWEICLWRKTPGRLVWIIRSSVLLPRRGEFLLQLPLLLLLPLSNLPLELLRPGS